MRPERTDLLRRRPNSIRYFFLAVSSTGTLHTGMSHAGLEAVVKDRGVDTIYLGDTVTSKVFKVKETAEEFLELWRMHYNDVKWSYSEEGK